MAFTTIEQITIYCANAVPGDTIPAADWQGNQIWQGALYLPHENGLRQWSPAADRDVVVLATGGAPTPSALYTQLLTYCPDFSLLNAAANCDVTGGDSVLSPLFRGWVRSASGVPGAHLHIVTCGRSAAAYVYTVDYDTVSDAFAAQILPDGSLVTDSTVPLSLPRIGSSGFFCRFSGCVISVGGDGLVSAAADCRIAAAQSRSGIGRRVSAYFLTRPETHEDTRNFLNQWIRQEQGPVPSIFLKGFWTGLRLRYGEGPDGVPAAAEPVSAAGGGAYDEKSFLSGLAVGRCASRNGGTT